MATSMETVLMTGEFAPESFGGVLLSGNAFNFLGVPPVVGRTIQPTDIRADGDAEPVVVLSHRLWLRLFEGSPVALGRTLRLNGRPHTIVGVMPPRFGWYGNEGFWLPLSPGADGPAVHQSDRAPGARRVEGGRRGAARRLQRSAGAREARRRFRRRASRRRCATTWTSPSPAARCGRACGCCSARVAFLLLIACANVANLQLARGTARAREMAVRMSIGAGRRRLLRQLLTESVLLSLAGGVLGVLFAFGAIRSIVGMMPEFYVPNESRVTINLPVLAVLARGLGAHRHRVRPGAGAADVQARRDRCAEGEPQHRLPRARAARTRNVLVVVEVALSVVLLVSAGLTMRTFFALQNMSTPASAPIASCSWACRCRRPSTRRSRSATVLRRNCSTGSRNLPGVEAATHRASIWRTAIPLHDRRPGRRRVEADRGQSGRRRPPADVRAFRCARGRMFDAAEVRRGDRVAVINEAALKLWPAGENPIGARLRLGVLEHPPPRTLGDTSQPPEVTIVGVIANTRNAGLRTEPLPVVALPYSVLAPLQRMLAVRTRRRSEPAAQPGSRAGAGDGSRSSRSAVRSRSAKCSARKSSSRGSRWRCSARSPRSAWRLPPPASTASCRSTSPAARTSSACAWRSARRAATCSG